MLNKSAVRITLIILFLQFAAFLYAQNETDITAYLDKNSANVGDVINFTVKAVLPEGAYISANQNIIFENFDVLDLSFKHVSFNPNAYEINFKIASYKTGLQRLEPAGIFYINAEGDNDIFFTPEKEVKILSILDESYSPRDIKPLVKTKFKTENALVILLLLAFIGVLIFIIVKTPKEKAIPVPPTPVEEALSRLENLYKSGVIEKGEPRVFYYELSDILRTYISKKYSFNAMEMTTTELIKMLDKQNLAVTKEELKKYMKIFDLARYAAFKPGEKEMRGSYDRTLEFLGRI